MKTFNPAILFFCLFGERESFTWNDTQSGRPHHDFVQLYEQDYGEIGDVTRRFPRFLGVRRTRNTSITFNDNVKNNCNTFLDEHSESFQENYFNYVIFALKRSTDPQISSESISKIIEYHNKKQKEWFYEAYKIAYSTNCLDPDASLEKCITIYRQLLLAYELQINELEHQTDNAEDYAPRDIKKEARIVVKEWFDRKKASGRYKIYIPTEKSNIVNIVNHLLTDDGRDDMSLYDILFNYDDLNEHSVNLCGVGGSGKTHQIFGCIDKAFSCTDNGTIPIYIPLNEVHSQNTNCLISYLANTVKIGSTEEVCEFLKENGKSILLACDGFNEIASDEMRNEMARAICEIRQLYKTRILISSRIDHTALFNSMNHGESQEFIKAKVQPLTEEQIDNYFSAVGCKKRYRSVALKTRELLQTPQGCVMYADLVGNKPNKTYKSLGKLIQDYIKRILQNNSDLTKNDDILKTVAYSMVNNGGRFNIRSNKLHKILCDSDYNWLIAHKNEIETVFPESDGIYQFIHQNFRDYYCGLSFAEQIDEIENDKICDSVLELFSRNNTNTNDEILELASSFISNKAIQEKLNIIKSNKEMLPDPFKDNYDFPLQVLIKLYAFRNDNNISKLDLSGLDLHEVSLSGYKLYNSEHRGTSLNGSSVSLSTFLKPGLLTASSTICKYESNGKLFIAAFARSTALIIDIQDNQYEVIRNITPDCGWVNVAYPKAYNDELAIFLAHRNGDIRIFYPEKKENKKKRFIRTKTGELVPKGHGEIEALEFVTWNGIEYIVACNSTGEIFYRELLSDDKCSVINILIDKKLEALDPLKAKEEALDALKALKDRFDEKDWDITCQLSHRKDNDTILVAFGKKIACLDGNSGSVVLTPLKVKWHGLNPGLILDICAAGQYLFVNEGNLISVLKFVTDGADKVCELIVDCKGSMKRFIDNRAMHLHSLGKYDDKKIERIKAYEEKIAKPIDTNTEDFRFKYFSLSPSEYYPGEDVVLIGVESVKGKSDVYSSLFSFIEIHAKSNYDGTNTVFYRPHKTEHKLATHSAVYYKLNDTVYMATTSDDRSVDLSSFNEEIPTTHIEGSYDGVRDIRFIDKDSFVAALYDGSVIHISKTKSAVNNEIEDDLELDDEFYMAEKETSSTNCASAEENWVVTGTIKSHDDWVWKIIPAGDWQNNKYVVSCSYDQTVKKSDFSKESNEPSVLIKGKEKIVDLYASKGDYWALSEHFIYQTTNSECFPFEKYSLKCFVQSEEDEDDNVPLVFYTNENGNGQIGKYTNRDLYPIKIELNGAFIRKMSYKTIDEKKYLILIGTKNKMSFIAMYSLKTKDTYALIADRTIPDTKGANSVAIVNIAAKKYILIANKDDSISICSYENDTISVLDIITVDGQPLCIDVSNNNMIVVGLLDGQIIELVFDNGKFKPRPLIKTHANLYSTPDVDLSRCLFEDESQKEQLKGYFTL